MTSPQSPGVGAAPLPPPTRKQRWKRIGIAVLVVTAVGPLVGLVADLEQHLVFVGACWVAMFVLFMARRSLPSAFAAVLLGTLLSTAVVVLLIPIYKDRDGDRAMDRLRAAAKPVPVDPDADRTRIAVARSSVCTSAPSDQEIKQLVAALKATKREEFAAAQKKLPELESIDKDIKETEARLAAMEPPGEPQEPSYEKPDYSGAWVLSGQCRGTFEDKGIVILKSGTYYVVAGADPCTSVVMTGCVTSTGRTLTLDLGRDGREAQIVALSDSETCRDDRATYRDEVRDAQASYAQARREYPQEVREWRATVAKAKRDRPPVEAELRTKQARRTTIVLELAACATSAQRSAASTAPAQGATPAAMQVPPHAVDPDCYGEGLICDKSRVKDAERCVEVLVPFLTKSGWDSNCFEVSVVTDAGEPDAAVIALMGPGTQNPDPTCREASARPAAKAALVKLAPGIARELRAVSGLGGSAVLIVTNGHGDELQVPVR